MQPVNDDEIDPIWWILAIALVVGIILKKKGFFDKEEKYIPSKEDNMIPKTSRPSPSGMSLGKPNNISRPFKDIEPQLKPLRDMVKKDDKL